jgi:CBS domain-containing protein
LRWTAPDAQFLHRSPPEGSKFTQNQGFDPLALPITRAALALQGQDAMTASRDDEVIDRIDRAQIIFRRVHLEHVRGENRLSVLCPRRMQLLDVGECRRCEHCRGLCIDTESRELFLRCAAPQACELASPEPDALLSEIASFPALCVPDDSDLEEAIALLDRHGIGAVPVVDAGGIAVGIVGKSELVRCLQALEDDDRPAAGPRTPPPLRDVMSHVVFTLHAGASVHRAAALMAYEGVHHIVITSADGRAIGILSSLDILGWLARRSGYVLPDSMSPRRDTQGE